jgi:hypothetical protein
MLIGGGSGLFVGSLFDIQDIDETESALSAISSSVGVGHPTVLALVDEQGPELIDAGMHTLGGTVLRRAVDDVEAEIAAAEKAQQANKLRPVEHEARPVSLVQTRAENHTQSV